MNGSSMVPKVLGFGPFELNLTACELRKYGLRIKLQEKPFQILVMLLEQSGELVPREHLKNRLWSADTFVDFDQSLNTAIKKLRQALGDSADAPRYVETQARRGYRFLAPVRVVQGAPQTTSQTPEPTRLPATPDGAGPQVTSALLRRVKFFVPITAILILAGTLVWLLLHLKDISGSVPRQIRSIVVLPLTNLSGMQEQDYFADGLTDALIGRLARISALRVISRTSAMQYKGTRKLLPEIARDLHVDAAVEGAVQRFGNRVRVSAQLLDAGADRPLWSQSYDRDARDILTLQNEIAAAIVQQIRIQLSPQEKEQFSNARTTDPEAYEAYLRGRFFWNNRSAEGLKKSVEYFEQALVKQPDYALAYAGLADSYNMFSYYGVAAPRETFPRARQAAQRALELDPNLAEAHAALAFGRLHFDWDWSGAESEFKQAISLNPGYANAHHWYSHYLMATGQTAQSLEECRRALALDPLNVSVSTHLAHEYIYAGKFDLALDALKKTLELNPNSARARVLRAEAFERKSQFADAEREAALAVALSPNDPFAQAALAHIYAASGDSVKARGLLASLISQSQRHEIGAYQVAVVYTSLKDPDRAFEWLRKAVTQHAEDLFYLKVDPDFRSLRSDPRFGQLLQRLGLKGRG